MKNELYSAANFLVYLLESSNITNVQSKKLFTSIVEILRRKYCHNWYPEAPNKGTSYRCIRINNKIDSLLLEAGVNCKIDEHFFKQYLPNELIVWIDPGKVSYRIGEYGNIMILYDTKHDKNFWKPVSNIQKKINNTLKNKIISNNSTSFIDTDYLLDPKPSINIDKLANYILTQEF